MRDLNPREFRITDIDAKPDKHGKYGYTLEWCTETGKFRGQCFRSDPEQTRASMLLNGYSEALA